MFPVCLTMEEKFIVTGLLIVVVGTVMGFLIYWAFAKDNAINSVVAPYEYYFFANTWKDGEPIQVEGYVEAWSEEDAIQKLIESGAVSTDGYEFLDLYVA